MHAKMGSKIVYIAGLGHSGTTIPDMSLGTLPGVVGQGELKSIMDEHSRDRHYTSICSCGKKAEDCVVWKNVPRLLETKQNDDEKLKAILTLLKNTVGEKVVMADSSIDRWYQLNETKSKV